MSRPSTIAIDGPVASGKTAVGRLLAQRLEYRFLDTGSMYRAVTWVALKRDMSPYDEAMLGQLAQETVMDIRWDNGMRVLVDRCDITDELRQPEVERAVSLISRVGLVRRALVEQQQHLASGGRIVVAGRDVGTVVLPQADLKLFLRASPEERAQRRYTELVAQSQQTPLKQVLEELEQRDRLDSCRTESPLRPAEDAHLLDTDGIDVEQVVERILAMMEV